MRVLASDLNDVFGTIAPGNKNFSDPYAATGHLFANGIRLFILLAAIVMLVYLFWGAMDWITSKGEEEKIVKARNKIMNSILGIIIVVIALGLFSVVTGDILGIITRDPNGGWVFTLPQLAP